MDEVVIEAPRYDNEDIAWSGLLPETVITAPRHVDEDVAWSGLEKNAVFAQFIELTEPYFAFAQTIPDEPAKPHVKIKIKKKIDIEKGDIIGENYHVPVGDTVDEDITVGGGNAKIEGVIDGDLAVMGGIVEVSGLVDGDVAVFGGNLDITGTVDGDAAVMGGNINNRGTITGDLFVVGGTVRLDSGSVVQGDISMVGGTVDRDENAEVLGEITSVEIDVLHKIMPRIGKAFRFPKFLPGAHIFPRIFFIAAIIVMYLVNLLIFLIFPGTIEKIVEKLQLNVWASVGLGVGLEVLYVPLIVLFAVSVIGIPLIPVFVLAVFLSALFGFSALSLIIGDKVTNGMKWNVTNKPGLFSIGWLSIMIIPIIVHLIGPPISILGWIITYVALTIGIGAVIYTLIKKNPKTKK
jgi:hypothetical protein